MIVIVFVWMVIILTIVLSPVTSFLCIPLFFTISEQEVPDPEIMVAFPIVDDPQGAAFVAWTTTPWTLPSNLALCVNPNFVYVKVSYTDFA